MSSDQLKGLYGSLQGLSRSDFDKYGAAAVGLTVSGISLASINYKEQMIGALYSCGSTVLSVSKEILGTYVQHPIAAAGVIAGGCLALQAFSKPSDMSKSLVISTVASTVLVSMLKYPGLIFAVAPAAVGVGLYKYHEYYSQIISDAEAGNQEAIKKLINSIDYLTKSPTETNKKRAGKVLINVAKELYASSKNEALWVLCICFLAGLDLPENKNAAMLCLNRMNRQEELTYKEAQKLIVTYNLNSWSGPVQRDPAIEKLIDSCLGIETQVSAHPAA